MVCNLLTQIFELAERTRAAKASARRQVSDVEESISLIELIQASYAVFERYGIGPPDDAVYHRYLLSLSINPERDWRKKILNFDLGSQPRVKRLCTNGGHRHSGTEAQSGSKVPSASADTGIQRRQRAESKHSLVRQASLPSKASTPLKKPTQGSGIIDRFGDMLSLDSPIERIHDKRRAFTKTASSKTPSLGSGQDSKLSGRRVAPLQTAYSEEEEDEANNDESFPLTAKGSANQKDRIAAGERQLQMITTSIEQWRATQKVKQLVNQNKLQDLQSRQQITIPLCTHAIFHWVTLCLPEKLDFHVSESPRALPLCVLQRISVDVKVLKKSARRLWVWQMKTLLKTWREDALRLKTFRVRMIVKQRAAVLETAFQCIQRWRLFTETNKCSADRAHWITQRSYRSKLRICLIHWRYLFQDRQQQQQASRHHKRRVFRHVLRSWQRVLESRRDERSRYEMARKWRCFTRWKRDKERKQASRALLCVTDDQRRLRLLGDSWNRLRANFVRNHTTRTMLEFWGEASCERRRKQVFRLWKEIVDRSRGFRARDERFQRYRRRRLLSQTFVSWATWTERQGALATVLAESMETREAKQLSVCFKSWKNHCEEASQLEEEMVIRIIKLRRRGLWDQWRKRTGTRSATRYLVSAYSLHLLAQVFTSWKKHAKRKAELRFAFLECQHQHKIGLLSLHWNMLVINMQSQHHKQLKTETLRLMKLLEFKRVCLAGWQGHAHGQRECRLRGEQLKHSARRLSLMRSSWSSWRRAFWLQNVARLADDQLFTYRKSCTFRLWKNFVVHVNHRRERTLKVVEMIGCFHLHACFRQWKDLVSLKHRLNSKSELVQRMSCRRRWVTWRQELETRRGQHEKLSAVASRWQNRQLHTSFRSWKAIWTLRKRHRHLLQATLLTSGQRVLEIHFNAWKGIWHASASAEHQVVETQEKVLRFKVKRAIQWWNAVRLDRHKSRHSLAKSLALWRQTLLKSVFQCLVEFKQSHKQQKAWTQLARSRYCKRSMQFCFVSWSKWWQRTQQQSRKLDAARLQLDRLRMQRVIQGLRRNATSTKRLRRAHDYVLAMSASYAKVMTLSRWKAFVVQKHSNRLNNAAQSLSMRNIRVCRRILRWREFVRIRKLMKHLVTRAVTASTASQLKLHLKSWKTFVERQKFTRALKKKAAAFRYFCLLPLHFKAWRQILSSKELQQELLLRARGLWCHQTESRAFQSWVQYSITNRQTKRAVAKWRNQTISRSFASWKRFELLQKKKARNKIRAVNFYEQLMCHKTLQEWRLKTRHDRMSRQCALMWSQSASRRAFDTWTRHVRVLQSIRKSLVKMHNQTLARVFTAWKESIAYRSQQLQGIQERLAQLWMMDTRATRFARWKRYAYLHSFIRKKFRGQREILLQHVVKEWKRVAASSQRSTQGAKIVADRAKLAVMQKYWGNWHAKARLLRGVKTLSGKVTEKRVAFDLRDRLRRWKQFTFLSLSVKEFVHRQELNIMRLVFIHGFQRFTQLKWKDRDLAEKISSAHETYLKEWLARKLQHRMAVIAACEDIRRAGSSKRLLTAAWGGWMSFHVRKQTQQACVRQFRVQISRQKDCGSSLGTAALAGILRQWQAIQLARVFERWNDVTQVQQRARLHALRAMEWWHKTQCDRYFHGWTRFCSQQRKQRRIRAMSTRNKLKRMWKLWQAFKALSQSKKEVNLSARRLYATHVYQCSFRMWRAASTSLRLQREQIMELYHSSRLRLLAALLGEWRKFAAMEHTKRMQKTVARVVHEQKLMRRSFTEWEANVAGICFHRRQLQINTERLQMLLLCSAFRAWQSLSRQQRKLKTVLRVLTNKCDDRVASRVLSAWHVQVDKATRLRHQSSSFLRFRRMQKGVIALRSLVREQQYLRTIRQKAQLFSSALSDNHVSLIFSRWGKLAVLSRKTRAATLRYLQNKLLPAAWKEWAAYVQRKRTGKDKTLTAALCWKNAFLRKAWIAMLIVHKAKKKHHAMITRAEVHYRNLRLRETLTQWSQWSKENQHFRVVCGKLLSRWRMQTAYRCFCAFHDHAVCCKALRTSAAIIRTKVRTAALLRSWYAWRKLILILRSGKRRLLQRCWSFWIRSRESRKVLQGFQEQIQVQVLRSTQRRCLVNWKQFVATSKIEKAMVLMSTAFAGSQVLKRVWLYWMKYVAQTRTIKARMRNALIHMHLQLQFKAFRALQAYTVQQKWKHHATARVLAFRSQRLQARNFFEWKVVVVERISRRRKLSHYLNVMQHSVQTKSFGAWHSFAARRKSLRVKMSQSLAMRSRLCSRVVFQAWKSFVGKTQRNRIAQGFSDAKVSAHAMKHWKQFIVLCRIQFMIGANELRQVESSFLSWRKAVAATHQIRAFRAKSARRKWLELVGMVFTRWKQRSQTHGHCRKLLASVAVGNHLRFRFMLWQRFTAHRKRLANLLLVVVAPTANLPDEGQPRNLEDRGLEGGDNSPTAVEGENIAVKCSPSEIPTSGDSQEDHDNARELVSLGQALAKKARVLQRFEVTWDLPQAWHRWRQIFHAQLFYRMRRLQFVFICWQKFTHQQRRNRWIVIKLANQRQAASAQTIFRAWAELVARVKQLQKDRLRERELWVLVTTEMARRERRQLKKHWHAWKFHVEEARHLQTSLVAYHQARLLTKHWLVWRHDYRQIMSEARQEAQRVDSHMRGFNLHRAVRSLRDHQQHSKRARLVLEYFGNRRYDTLVPEMLSRWRRWCQRQKEISHCLEVARRYKTLRHLTAWQTWKNTRKWQHVVVNKLQSKSVEQRRREVWVRWRRYVNSRVVKDLALQKAAIFHVCSRLRKRWLYHAQREIQVREHAETAHLQLYAWRGHRAVSRWREYSLSRRLRRLYHRFVLQKHIQLWQLAVKHAVATRFDEVLMRSKATKMLSAWQQLAAKHQDWRQLCASFVGKKAVQTTRRMFMRWQQLVNARQGERLAAMHAEQTTLRKLWRCWSRATLASQLRRHEQLEQAAEHEALTVLRQSLCVWQAAVKKQRERRFVLLSCVVKLKSVASHRVQDVVFRSWKRFIDRERRCGMALSKRDYNTAKRALSYWLTWTRSRQQRRQYLESAANYHSQRLKSAVFFYWQTYALAWQDAAKPIARRLDRQMSLPARSAVEPHSAGVCEDSDGSEADVRRPTSPVVKRLRQKKVNRMRPAEDADNLVTLPDVVEISMDVKKRMMLLGKWKSSQNGKAKPKFLSSSR